MNISNLFQQYQQQPQMQHQQFQQQQQRFQQPAPVKPKPEDAIKQNIQVPTDYHEVNLGEEQLSHMDRQVLDQTISQATTLLAQQLSNKTLTMGESVEKPTSADSSESKPSSERGRHPASNTEEMENLEDPSDLGGLEVDGDEVMELDDDFDIMEFADAIDNLEHQNEGDKNDLEKKEKRKMSVVDILSSDEPPSILLAQGDQAKQQASKVTQQPPPYTVVATAAPTTSLARGPPPPYPGQNQPQSNQPVRVSFFKTFWILSILYKKKFKAASLKLFF